VWRRQAFAQPETRAKEGSAPGQYNLSMRFQLGQSPFCCVVSAMDAVEIGSYPAGFKVSLRENVLRSFSDLFYRK